MTAEDHRELNTKSIQSPMKKLTVLFALIVCFPAFASSTYKVLHTFNNGPDGASPSGLVLGKNGEFYGVTLFGGKGVDNCGSGGGTIFEISRYGKKRTIYEFTGNADGCGPMNTLALGADGNL